MSATAVEPRIRYVSDYATNRGQEAIDLAESAGLHLDEWQRQAIIDFCGVRPDGKWSSFECALNVPRQNGKGSVLEAMELAWLYLWGERYVIHSSHQFDTSLEAFRRLTELIEGKDELRARVKKIKYSHGEEGIEFVGGQRIRFRTRTRGGGRGFSCDKLVLDEAMFLPEFAFGSLLPTMSAMPNPQVLYTGSAADEEVHENAVVWARVRARGIKAEAPSLSYIEYSIAAEHPTEVSEEMMADLENWRTANPAMGIRIDPEHIGYEFGAMDSRSFAVERLGAGAYPSIEGLSSAMIQIHQWDALMDKKSKLKDPVCIAFEVNPERRAAISAAGRRPDGQYHVEVIASGVRASQLPAMLQRLDEVHEPLAIVCNGYGPSASVVASVEETGVKLIQVSASDHAKACGLMLDNVNDATVRHLGSEELRRAIKGAGIRPLAEAWVWSHKNSNADISPLVSATLALWAEIERPDDGTESMIF